MLGRTAVRMAVEGLTKRRTLIPFVRQALRAQPALSVRGSSRRITSMRFRPANTRVINRRDDRFDRHSRCFPLAELKRPNSDVLMMHARPESRGKSGDPISASDSGERFVKTTARTAMHGTTLVMTSPDHAPIVGEKTVLPGSAMTSNSFVSQLRSGMAGIPS